MTGTASDQPQKAMFPVEDLKWVCGSLCALLETENAALIRHDADAVRKLSENKVALSKLYEKTMKNVRGDTRFKDQLSEDEYSELSGLGTRLAELIERNAIMLRAEIEARNRMLEVFVSAAKARTRNIVNYGRKGMFDQPSGSRARLALAYNKTL